MPVCKVILPLAWLLIKTGLVVELEIEPPCVMVIVPPLTAKPLAAAPLMEPPAPLYVPVTLVNVTPFAELLVLDTLLKFRVTGEVRLAWEIAIAALLVALIFPVAEVTVICPVLSTPSRPIPLEVVISSAANIVLPVLVLMATPLPADAPLFTVVPAKVTVLAELAMEIPMPPGLVMVVLPVTVVVPPPTE